MVKKLKITPSKKLFLFFMVFVVLNGIIFSVIANGQSLHLYSGESSYLEGGWEFSEKGQPDRAIQLGDRQWIEPGKTYILSTQLTYNGDGDPYPCAMLAVNHFGVRVYLDHEEIFHYVSSDVPYPVTNSLGLICFSVPVGNECAGKVIEIELESLEKYSMYRHMPDVSFGDYSSMMYHLVMKNILNFITTLALLFMAFLLLVSDTVAEGIWEKIHFFMFACLFAAYRVSEDQFLLHIIARPYLMHLCNYLTLAALPIPLLMAYWRKTKSAARYILAVPAAVSALNIIVQSLLHFSQILDVRRMLTYTHICLAVAIFCLIVFTIAERKNPRTHYMQWHVIFILAGALIDFIIYFIEENNDAMWHTTGNMTGLGFLMVMFLAAMENRHRQMELQRFNLHKQMLEEMAYKDILTGLGNRTAFQRDKEYIASGKYGSKPILCLSADVNGLKKVNDTLGHQAGDRLIKDCGELLDHCFGNQGKVYRIGGDEFTAFLYDVSEAQWPDLLLKLKKESQEYTVSFAIGYAQVVEMDVNRAIKSADERMYENKRLIKEQLQQEKHSVS